MPRKKLIYTNEFAYHITNRANNKEFFYIPNSILWGLFIDVFKELEQKYGFKVVCFVLMSNHYHLIAYTPNLNLGECMKYMHREIAKRANKISRRENHFFGGRYKWSVIYDETYLWNAVKYVFRNPIEANLVSDVESYKYSSLNSNDFNWFIPDLLSDIQNSNAIDWYNHTFSEVELDAIRCGLRKSEFKKIRRYDGGYRIELTKY